MITGNILAVMIAMFVEVFDPVNDAYWGPMYFPQDSAVVYCEKVLVER